MGNNILPRDWGGELRTGAGYLKVAPWFNDTTPSNAFYDLGEMNGFVPTSEVDQIVRNSRRNFNREQIDERPSATTRQSEITVVSTHNLVRRLFWGGVFSTLAQSATPVADEKHEYIPANYEVYFGYTAPNYRAVFGAGTITVDMDRAGTPLAARADSTTYAVGDYVTAVESTKTYVLRAMTAGDSAGSAPTFDETLYGETADGEVTWRNMGEQISPAVEGTHYLVDDTEELGARIQWIGNPVGVLWVNYTPTAIAAIDWMDSGGNVSTVASAIFEERNAATGQTPHFFHKVRFAPNGGPEMIADGSDYLEWPLTMSILSGEQPAVRTGTRP